LPRIQVTEAKQVKQTARERCTKKKGKKFDTNFLHVVENKYCKNVRDLALHDLIEKTGLICAIQDVDENTGDAESKSRYNEPARSFPTWWRDAGKAESFTD
jgi:hypothetical protein